MRSLQGTRLTMSSPAPMQEVPVSPERSSEAEGLYDHSAVERTLISDHRPISSEVGLDDSHPSSLETTSKHDSSLCSENGQNNGQNSEAEYKPKERAPSTSVGTSMVRGSLVGRYVLLDLLGAGGMGEVYAAYDPQLDRKVALKFLRTDLFSEGAEGQSRLMREAQAMARLSHPNVIAVHDVGMLQEHVFVAMEFVEGMTLTRWLKQRHTWREVLEVMKEAGQGLAAAHRAGLVHRDFKPDNVLLPKEGHIRVLDFGLARSAKGEEAEKALQRVSGELPDNSLTSSDLLSNPITHAGAIVGTPLYMAPEQLRGENADSRSDQYSFCVVLYEALYGKLPFEANTLAALKELKQKVPEKPVDSSVPAWIYSIVVKGLSIDREDRFAGIEPLLVALEKDPTTTRRRMHLGVVAAFLLLLAGVGVTIWGSTAPDSCEQSAQSIHEIWNAQQEQKIRSAFSATDLPYAADAFLAVKKRLQLFTNNWFTASIQFCKAPHFDAANDDTRWARQVCFNRKLSELKSITQLFATATPEVVENARKVVESLQDPSECTELVDGLKPPKDQRVREQVEAVRIQLVEARTRLGAGRYAKALKKAQEAVQQAATVKYRPLEAEALLLLAQAQDKQGDWNAARVSLESALLAAEIGKHDEVTARIWTLLVWVAGYRQAQYAEGRKSAKHALAWLERIGNPLSIRGDLYQRLGSVAFGEGKYAQALNYYQKAKDLRVKLLGSDHYEVARAAMNLANAYSRLGRLDEALLQYNSALTTLERQLGAQHPDVARLLINLGISQTRLGNQAEALSCYQRAYGILERSVAPEHPQRAMALQTLASAQLRSGNLKKAEQLALQGFEIREKTLGADHPSLAPALSLLASIRMRQNQHSSALELYRRALSLQQSALGNSHPEVAARHFDLGLALAKLRRLEESYKHFEQALSIRRKALGEDHPDVAECYSLLAQVQLASGKPSQALPLFQQALRIHEKTLGKKHPSVASDLTGLARAQLAMGRPRLAAKLLDRSLKIRQSEKSSPRKVAETKRILAEARSRIKKNSHRKEIK